MWCHMTALSGLFVPFGNLIGPLIIWQMKRHEFPSVDEHGKESLNFQLSALIYLIGGQGASDTIPQRYDPAKDEWSELPPLSTKRDHTVAVALEGKVWALGGRLGPGTAFDSVEIYDPAANSWSAGPPMKDTRSGFGAAVVDGRIYAAGGEILVQPYFVRDTAEVYDPATKMWSYKEKLPMPLHGTGGAALNGKFYLFGGASQAASADPKTGVVHILTP